MKYRIAVWIAIIALYVPLAWGADPPYVIIGRGLEACPVNHFCMYRFSNYNNCVLSPQYPPMILVMPLELKGGIEDVGPYGFGTTWDSGISSIYNHTNFSFLVFDQPYWTEHLKTVHGLPVYAGHKIPYLKLIPRKGGGPSATWNNAIGSVLE